MDIDYFKAVLGEGRLSGREPPLKDRVKFLRDIANGFERGQAFYTAMEMGLFTLLTTSADADRICEETGIRKEYAAGYLDILASLGVLVKDDGRYMTSPELTPFLVESSPYYARYLKYSAYRRQLWADLMDTLKNGSQMPPDSRGYEMKISDDGIDYMAYGAMLGRLQFIVRIVAETDEFRQARKLIDLGGSHGLFAIAFAQENLHLESYVFDRPEVVARTERYIAMSGLADRVKPLAGDYLADDIGSGYDVALDICSLSGNEDRARSFYRKVSEALNPGGLFVKTTFTLDDDRCGPALTLMFDLEEKLSGHGHVHMSNRELTGIMSGTGLELAHYLDMTDQIDVPMRTFVFKKV